MAAAALTAACGQQSALSSPDVLVANLAPTATFSVDCTNLECSFDASSSDDSDGTIDDYQWDFGEGATATGSAVTHTYTAGGTYSVTLTVVDDDGESSSNVQSVALSGANEPPAASFVTNCTNLDCSFDASGSTTTGGSIVDYAWDFGDGANATGANATHSYTTDGAYTVVLSVTDDGGAASTSSQAITVATGLEGADLFATKCAACHGNDATGGSIAVLSIVGATADEIAAAIDSEPQMSFLASLTQPEIDAIAEFLASLVSGISAVNADGWSKIVVLDSSGTVRSTESDPTTGSFTLDASDLSGAVLAQAYFPNSATILYGYSGSAGRINITLLTDQAVRIASRGQIGLECFESPENAEACLQRLSTEHILVAEDWIGRDLATDFAGYGIDADQPWLNEPFSILDSQMGALLIDLQNRRIEYCGNPFNPNGLITSSDQDADCYPDDVPGQNIRTHQ